MSQSFQQNQSQTEKGVSTSAVDWQMQCQELIAERDKLQMELAEVKKDRDDYVRAVKALLPEKQYSFTKEELLSQVCKHPSFEELIAELEKDPGN